MTGKWWTTALLCAAIAVAAPLSAQPAPAPTVAIVNKRPVADFSALPFVAGPVLSPDGRRVAARLAIEGKQVLAILDVFVGGGAPFLVSLGENELNSWSWVNDDWLAIGVGAMGMAEGEPIYITRVASVDVKARTIKPIAFNAGGQGARVIWTARDGSPRILMARQRSIYMGADFWPNVVEVDLPTARMTSVQSSVSNVMTWLADPAGQVRMGIQRLADGRNNSLMYRDGAKGAFRTINRASTKADETLLMPVLLAGATPRAVAISAPDDRAEVYDFDFAKLGLGKKLFGVEGYDVDDVELTAMGDALAGVTYTSDRPRVKWFDPKLAEVQAQLDTAVGTRTATITSMNRAQDRMLVHVGDASQPGSYYFYDPRASGTMTRYTFVNPALKDARLGPVTVFRYKARDGLSIEAVLTLPKGRAATALRLILMPHGGPEARDAAVFDWWAQFLADRGYAVVQPNYRGSTGYGAAFRKAGDGEWGLKMQDDLNDVVDHLAKAGTIDSKRVCIVGASYGGYAAMRGAQRDSARYRCAISYAGVSDLNGMIRYDGQFLNGGAARDSWRQVAPDLRAVSPIEHAGDFGSPILIMHGKKDLRVPISQSRRMADRLRAAGKRVDYVEQPEGDHHFSREADRRQFLETMEAFLQKHNPA